jgi:hypothetical protein
LQNGVAEASAGSQGQAACGGRCASLAILDSRVRFGKKVCLRGERQAFSLFNRGGLSPDPKKAANVNTDLKILAEAKALGLNIFSNDLGVFNSTARGGGQLAKRVGVDVIQTGVTPRAPNFRARFVDAIRRLIKKP